MSLGRWCRLAWPLAQVPSILLVFAVVVTTSFDGSVSGRSLMRGPGGLSDFVRPVLLAPLVETLILAVGMWLLTGRVKRNGWAALISAVIWGVAHGLNHWLRFFGVVWSFFVFSCGWLAWSRISLWRGFVAAAVPHFLINLTVWIVRFLWW